MTGRLPITGPQDRFANLEGVRGENFSGEVQICQGDGVTPVNLMGYELRFFLWNGTVLAAEKVCETVPAEGVVKLAMSVAETLDVAPVAYHFELWADNGEGAAKLILWGFLWFRGECLS